MELFNTIKDYLLMPNDILFHIILFLGGIIEAFLIMNLIIKISDKNVPLFNRIIFVFLFTCSSLITINCIPSPYNIFVNYVICYISAKFLFKLSYLETLVNLVVSSSIFFFIGVLSAITCIHYFNISLQSLTTIPILKLYSLLITYILCTSILWLISKFKLSLKININLFSKDKFLIFTNFIFALCVVMFQMVCLFKNYYTVKNYTPDIFLFCSLLIYIGLNIFTLIKVTQLHTTNEKLENAEAYNKTLTILHDNVRGFKHDFDNIIATLGGFVDTKDLTGLTEYYKDVAGDCQKTNNLYALNPKLINNPGIYNLLISKYNKIEEKGIKLNLSMQLDFNKLNIKTYHLGRILGILLDNAIEASETCDEKIINLEFRTSHRAKKYIILIENTYSNQDVDTEFIFKKGFTEKDNHSGIGLWEVNQFLKNYDNIVLTTSKTNKYFSQQLDFLNYTI